MTVRRRRSDRSGRSKLHSPGRPDSARREELVRFWAAIATGRSSEDALQPLGHRPADDLHCGQILDGGEVEPAFVGRDVGDVSEPDRIGRSGFEVAVEQIGRDRMGVAAVGGDRPLPPASRWTNAVLSHELGDRALRDAKAAGLQLGMDPRRAVAPLALQPPPSAACYPGEAAPVQRPRLSAPRSPRPSPRPQARAARSSAALA